ncbi:MAG TPA: MFS transporter [Ilumatobacter sp.]|nr:MFS transporter [Ilumatobacter sp.]
MPKFSDFGMPVPVYLASFLMVGISLTFIGPALSELRDRSGSGIGGIGVLFAAQSIGYFFGSLAAGRLYDRFNGHRVFAAALLIIGLGMFLLPMFNSIGALVVVFVVIGLGSSSTDVGANLLLMWTLRANSGRAMNTLHLFFGFGALVSPLFIHVGLDLAARSATAFCVLLAVWTLATPAPAAPAAARDEHTDTTWRLLLLLATFFTLYVGLEIGFSGWIKTYGEEIDLSELTATWLTTVFWVGFTVGRMLSAALAQRFRPKAILSYASALTIVASATLIVGNGSTAPLWFGTALMGIATAPQFPVMFTYLERRIHITGAATAWFVAAAGIGGLTFPWLIGRWFDASGTQAVMWAVGILSVATTISFIASDRVLAR